MKIQKNLFRLAGVISIIFLAVSGCQNPSAVISPDKIVVIADSLVWEQVGAEIQKILEKEFITPQLEKVFNVVVHPPEDLGELSRYQNVLIVGTMQANDKTREMSEKMLSSILQQKVQGDSCYLFQKEDAWARNQLLILMIARDVAVFKTQAAAKADVVFQLFNDHLDKIQSRALYQLGEQKKIEDKLMMEHGWSVRVQHDYNLAVDSSKARFVWLRRIGPQREFFVYWQQVKDPSILSKEWMMSTRDSLTAIFYQGDKIHQDSTVHVLEQDVDFQGRFAIMLQGVWENLTLNVGGPFRSYGFYNESDRRLYLVDCSLFAPGVKKWPFLRQLDAMAKTFKTKDQ